MTLPIKMAGRRWAIAHRAEGGYALVIQLSTADEIAAVDTAINSQIDAERWYAEKGQHL
ncbi:hypothetical protein [Mangrovicoccus sp. HB161399]|uniref:hypothetical protein n=1 Tax=Mangrovicoccus sp. HB161399 TaxID=2720392 RepID=UPI001557EC5B|nr:hypothetical protein [Mangrovicoccus sp. HB161399]